MIPSPFDRSKIPHKPGVYIYKDRDGEILYVGKAIDLFSRVSSYFQENQIYPKTKALVEKIADVETIVVESELEALILEANLIKKFLPPYNIKLTDDKDYLYILITKETFPKVITGRKADLKTAKEFFGPFPSARVVRDTLKKLRRVFPWCSNPPKLGGRVQGLGFRSGRSGFLENGTLLDNDHKSSEVLAKTGQRPCFYRHLGLCPGACTGEITAKDYQKILTRFAKFMQGKKEDVIADLEAEMAECVKKLEFEQAAYIKKTIIGIHYILQQNKVSVYLENPNFVEDQNQRSLEQLQRALRLTKLPERIECFDISNIQGTEATGSMVVLTNGEIDKSQYRKFKIHITGKPNDVGMHKEMMQRRLGHPEWPFPDLMIIDGGRGQVRGAKEELEKKGVDIPIFGLAKRLEWLYHPEEEIIKLPTSSLAIRLLQKIRDEAHRFAITYHRKLRNKKGLGYSV